jgi:Zn-dependent oligopeptidase
MKSRRAIAYPIFHIFCGHNYAVDYYSYLWAEVLDADALEAIKETEHIIY